MGANDSTGGGTLVEYYAKKTIAEYLGTSPDAIHIYPTEKLREDRHLPEKVIRQLADNLEEVYGIVISNQELKETETFDDLHWLCQKKFAEND